jgi:predicted lipoprotein with Yx(FWY)xxD motif
MNKKLFRHGILAAAVLAILLPVLAACASGQTTAPAPSYTVTTVNKAGIGDYLVDGKGMTLYYFTRDTAGKSNATGQVIANWPIFYAANIVIPSSLNASDFGRIAGFNGQMQTTYKGWPLYYYIKDQAPGDTLGQGVGGVWYVVNPQSVPLPPSGS